MTDTPSPDQSSNNGPNNGQGAAPAGAPLIRVLAQYVKDLSFENPGLFAAQQGQGAPEIELGIDVRVEPGPPDQAIYAVELRLSAKAKRQEAVVFICELIYAGVFQLQGASREDSEAMLLIECPRLLFPFARRVIADVTREGGHPPLMIDPIDFVGLYRQQRQQAQQQAAPQPAT
jgi:preprotein translocase subunit SecB